MRKYIKMLVPEGLKKKYRVYKRHQYQKQIVGNKVHCPICNSNFKFFASGGMDGRSNARCHKCNSLERHRLLHLYLDKQLNFFEINTNIKILHFAPEKFFYNIFSNMKNVDYVPCDLFPDMYKYKGSAQIHKVDMTNIPFPDASFDFILHNQVLEHIPDDRLAMQELFRVMKSGGFGIFQVPIDYNRAVTYEDFAITTSEGRKKAFGQHDHVRWYGRDYNKRLENAGFVVKVDDFIKCFSNKEIEKYRLTNSELIYFCEKK